VAIVGHAALPAVARRIDLPKDTLVILVIGLRAIDLREVLQGRVIDLPARRVNACGAIRAICENQVRVIHAGGLVKVNAGVNCDRAAKKKRAAVVKGAGEGRSPLIRCLARHTLKTRNHLISVILDDTHFIGLSVLFVGIRL
jgi:hypothetical protein